MSLRRGNMQVHPVQSIFIKSPIPKQPYRQIRKIYETELSNSIADSSIEIDGQKLLEARERTRKILTQKQRKEALQNLLAIIILLSVSIILVVLIK